MNTKIAFCWRTAIMLVLALGYIPAASAAITITDLTNITLANSQVEVGGDTTDNPNVVNGPVGTLIAYTASASASTLPSPYNLSNLNDGDIGSGNFSDGTYAIPLDGTLTLSLGATKTIGSIAIYNGYNNRDDGTYLLQDAANNTLGGYKIATGAGSAFGTNDGVDSFWLTFNTPVTTTALKLTFAVPEDGLNTASFREIQVFETTAAVPEPASLSIWGLAALGCAVGARRRRKAA